MFLPDLICLSVQTSASVPNKVDECLPFIVFSCSITICRLVQLPPQWSWNGHVQIFSILRHSVWDSSSAQSIYKSNWRSIPSIFLISLESVRFKVLPLKFKVFLDHVVSQEYGTGVWRVYSVISNIYFD